MARCIASTWGLACCTLSLAGSAWAQELAEDPAATTEASPPPSAAPAASPKSSWDEVIQRSSAQERALETDEERERREERLARDSADRVTGRLGGRLDAGVWIFDVNPDVTNFMAIASGQLVHPFGNVVELVGGAGLAFGGGTFASYGPSLDFGVRLVLGNHFFFGAGAHFSWWYAEFNSPYGDCYGLDVICGSEDMEQEQEPLLGGTAGLGFYVDTSRRLALGLDVRLAVDTDTDGEISGYPALWASYLWPAW